MIYQSKNYIRAFAFFLLLCVPGGLSAQENIKGNPCENSGGSCTGEIGLSACWSKEYYYSMNSCGELSSELCLACAPIDYNRENRDGKKNYRESACAEAKMLFKSHPSRKQKVREYISDNQSKGTTERKNAFRVAMDEELLRSALNLKEQTESEKNKGNGLCEKALNADQPEFAKKAESLLKEGYSSKKFILNCDLSKVPQYIKEHRKDLVEGQHMSKDELCKYDPPPCDIQLIATSDPAKPEIVIYPTDSKFAGGSYGTVALAISYNHHPLELRVWKTGDLNQDLDKMEFQILSLLEGKPGIMKAYIGRDQQSNIIYPTKPDKDGRNKRVLISAFYNGGDLSGYMRPKNISDKEPSDKERNRFTRELLEGLKSMAEKGVVHRDIKPENVFVNVDAEGKRHVTIGDFGLAAKELAGHEKHEFTNGTIGYMSQEALTGEVNPKVDSWALGLVLFELYKNKSPKEAYNATGRGLEAAIKGIKNFRDVTRIFGLNCGRWFQIKTSIDKVLCGLLDPNPESRMSAGEGLKIMQKICGSCD